MIHCEDWRNVMPGEVAPLLKAASHTWFGRLGWDLGPSWAVVEPAREAGQLPGIVARDPSGRITGWTFFLRDNDTLQVATLAAEHRATTEALVDAVLASSEAADASSVVFFALDLEAPGLERRLVDDGFRVEPYRYLMTFASRFQDLGAAADDWYPSHTTTVARLCERAYADSTNVRPFATSGRPDEWDDYAQQLIGGPGCGEFLPSASRIAAEHGAPRGAIVMTKLSQDVAHVAQIVVLPEARGGGLGRRLMEEACGIVRAEGYQRITLLVAESNRPARALYEGLGFRPRATFLAAVADQPRRSTSPAHETGGASTFR